MFAEAFVSSGPNTLVLSPTRRIGPPPIGDSEKLLDVSRQSNRDVFGTVLFLAAAIAPTNPISSARLTPSEEQHQLRCDMQLN